MRPTQRWILWILVLHAAVLLAYVRGDLDKLKPCQTIPRPERQNSPAVFEDELHWYLRPDLRREPDVRT